ncbi:MAG: DUF4388 domain-containing protein [Deltaproteobacteria bacterium]|nr:DUF4388 domain-containing protein [Deltaproteobacteria bacterium]
MAFQGSLKELPLPDIIQLVSVSGKTGNFSLKAGTSEGEIHLLKGKIVHAEVGKLQGEEAVYEMAVWTEGDFVFVPGKSASISTIKKSNTNLLMEAARRIDEWTVLSKKIPSTRLVPVFTDQATTTSVSLTPQEWRVISKIDERRTVEELAVAIGVSPFEACKLLYGLLTSELVKLEESFSGIPIDRIGDLSSGQLEQLEANINSLSDSYLKDGAKLQELARARALSKAESEAGRPVDAVLDLIRSAEKAISSSLGPNRAKEFLGRVADFLQ